MQYLPPLFIAYILFLTALIGAVTGSFINCMAWRIAHGEKISRGRSHCPSCGHTLSAVELIPIFSFILQKGRCKSCGQKISPRYIIVEILTALIFISIVLRFGITLTALQYLILAAILLAAALVDLEVFIIPDRFIAAGIVLFLLFTVLTSQRVGHDLLFGLIGGLSVSLPVLLVSILMDKVLKKESMGGGDIKLLFVTGLFSGWQLSILNLIFACIIGIVFAFTFPRTSDGSGEEPKGAFPFGPAICASMWLGFMVGQPIIQRYISLF